MAKVIEIVKAHLVSGGFDGLVMPDAECGCLLDDLAPCGGDISDCEPGYRGVQPDDAILDGWSMYSTKEAARKSCEQARLNTPN